MCNPYSDEVDYLVQPCDHLLNTLIWGPEHLLSTSDHFCQISAEISRMELSSMRLSSCGTWDLGPPEEV